MRLNPRIRAIAKHQGRGFSGVTVLGEGKLKPYYEQDGITIYHGDCREILPTLPKVDLVLTDPPYGIGAGKKNFGMWRTSRMQKSDWDAKPVDDSLIDSVIRKSEHQILWGGNYYTLKPSRMFLVWDRGAGFKGRDFAECEQAWCSLDGNARVFSYDPLASGEYRTKTHPTQKPLPLMRWCLTFFPKAETVLDPFMGSGTTLLAAKLEGRQAIGIEIEEKYCEIAKRRLRQKVLF